MEITIDLHGMTVEQAKYYLIKEIETCDRNVWTIKAVHGYNNGTAIRDMIKYRLKHQKIKKIVIGDINKGVTLIELKH